MSCRYLVTGGCGFIGSCFVRYILENHPDYKVVNFDKLTYAGNINNLGDYQYHPNYSFIQEDICNIDKCNLNSGFDFIVHFAAESHVDRSIDDSYPFLRTNILGTHALLEYARKGNIPFLYISTDEVYGEILYGSNDEDSCFKPGSPYAVSKASADLLVQSYSRTYKLPCIITRSTNNYGPYQYPEKLIPLFVIRLLQGKKVGLYGDGKQMRDWIGVEDHVRALDLLLEKGLDSSARNEIYGDDFNIGSGEELTNLEVTRMILNYLKLDEDMIEFIDDRKGHDRRYSLDASKLKELGWNHKVGFSEGLRKTVDWYKSNEKFWEGIK